MPMTYLLKTAARVALAAAVGFMATANTCSAAVITLTSSGGGVYDYGIALSGGEIVTFDTGQAITLSGLSGVTGASVTDTLALFGEFKVSSFTPTSVVLTHTLSSPATIGPFSGPVTFGTLVVDSSVLTTGAVDYSIETSSGTFTGTVDGPATTAVPEASIWAMMLVGFAGLGYAGYRRAREQRAAV
jgi:hypothetical protein